MAHFIRYYLTYLIMLYANSGKIKRLRANMNLSVFYSQRTNTKPHFSPLFFLLLSLTSSANFFIRLRVAVVEPVCSVWGSSPKNANRANWLTNYPLISRFEFKTTMMFVMGAPVCHVANFNEVITHWTGQEDAPILLSVGGC